MYKVITDNGKIKEITNGTRGLSSMSTNAPSVDDNNSIRNSSDKINLFAQYKVHAKVHDYKICEKTPFTVFTVLWGSE